MGIAVGTATLACCQFSTVWSHTIHDGDDDRAFSAAFDAQGNAYVAGAHGDYLHRAGVLTKYAPDGTLLWSKTLSPPGSAESYLVKVKVRSDGLVAVCGMEGRNLGGFGPIAHLVSPAGTTLWTAYFDVYQFGFFGDLTFDAEGNVYLVGSAGVGIGDEDIFVARVNALGSIAWSRTMAGTAGSYDLGHSVAVNPAGEVVAMGQIEQSGGIDHTTVYRLSRAAGAEIGRVLLSDGGGDLLPLEMVLDATGYPVLVGNATGGESVWIGKLSPTLALLWSYVYEHPDFAAAKGVALDAFGNVRALTSQGMVSLTGGGILQGTFELAEEQEVLTVDPFGNGYWLANTATGTRLRKVNPSLTASQAYDLIGHESDLAWCVAFSPRGDIGVGGSHWIGAGHDASFAVVRPAYGFGGTVTLQDFGATTTGVAVTVRLHVQGAGTPFATVPGVLGAAGALTIGIPVTGTMDVRVKASHWLTAVRTNVVVGNGGVTGQTFSLKNGDVNGDNAINIADFIQFRVALGSSSGSANWNPNADLDGNGSVAIADFLVLRRNFGSSGA